MDGHLDEDRGVIGFDIKVNPEEFGPALMERWAIRINFALSRAAKNARNECRRILRQSLKTSREYKALFMEVQSAREMGLQGELGIEDPESTVNAIIEAVVGALRVDVIKSTGKYYFGTVSSLGGLRVVIVPQDLKFLLNLGEASYSSYGGEVEWLSWLLYSGTEVIISDYYVMYGHNSPASRTNDAIMVKSGESKKNFRIAPFYAGTAGNNWITRAGVRAEERIKEILVQKIRDALS